MEIGEKVIMKSDGCKGIISHFWNPYLKYPKVFNINSPTGYIVTLETGNTRICIEDDFEIDETNLNNDKK